MPSSNDALDLLWGAEAIAAVIDRTPTATFYLLEKGSLPAAKKVGGRWCISRRALAEMFKSAAA